MNVKQFYRYVFVFLLSVFVFTGCGSDNGGGEFVAPDKVGYVIDSPVANMDYECGTKKAKTDNQGKFECSELPVTFRVAGIEVGILDSMTADSKVYPQDLAQVGRDNFTDDDVIKIAVFLQSLDDDGNIATEITLPNEINSTQSDTLAEMTLDEITTFLISIGKTPVSQEDAIKHLKEEFNIDVTKPVITLNGASSINLTKGTAYPELGATANDDRDGTIAITTSGTVDVNTVGTYTITYKAVDSAGNEASLTRTVNVTEVPLPADTTKPVITLNGTSSISLTKGTAYTELGATATDDRDGTVAVITSGTVDVNTVNSYTITYTAKDSAGNEATVTRSVIVTEVVLPADTTKPVITLNGTSSISLTKGTAYTELGATATDDRDGTVAVTISGTVDVNTVNSYTITYTAKDSAGNEANLTRSVIVTEVVLPADTTKPVITLNGASSISLTKGTAYTELGATATDDRDTTVSVTTSGSVDITKVGSYTITYKAVDSAGNEASVTRTVNVVLPPDTTKPVITLNGANPLELTQGTAYTELGATATDDRDATVKVTTTGSVDVTKVGTNTITYKAKDSAGNEASVTRTVNVVLAPDTTKPVMTLNGANPLELTEGTAYTELGATATDDRDATVTVTTSGSVDVTKVGTYTITYKAVDSAGNEASVTRTVNVVLAPDTTKPVITLNGANPLELTQGTAYTELGATATDDRDGNVTVTISGNVDVNTVGSYTITYKAVDSAGNEATVTRTVNVVESTPTTLKLSDATIVYSSSPALNQEFNITIEENDDSEAVTKTQQKTVTSEYIWSVISQPDGSNLVLTPSADTKSVVCTPTVAGKYKIKVQSIDNEELTSDFGILKEFAYDEDKKTGITGIIENQYWVYSSLTESELTTIIAKYPDLTIVGFQEGRGTLVEYNVQNTSILEVIENLKLEKGIIDVSKRELSPFAGSKTTSVSNPPDENWQLDFIDIEEVKSIAGKLATVDIGMVDGGFATTEGYAENAKRVLHKDLKTQFKTSSHGILTPYEIGLKKNTEWEEMVKDGVVDDTDYCKEKYINIVYYGKDIKTQVEGSFAHGIAVSGTIGAIDKNLGINQNVKLRGDSYYMEAPFFRLSSNNVKVINYSAGKGEEEFKCKSGLFTKDEASFSVTEEGKQANIKHGKNIRKGLKSSEKDILLIVAAGNGEQDAVHENGGIKYSNGIGSKFTQIDNLIIVAAMVKGDNNYLLAPYSAYGESVDIAAPTGFKTPNYKYNERNTYKTSTSYGITGYGGFNGTSAASPVVSGVASIIFGMNPNFTPKEVKSILIKSAIESGKFITKRYVDDDTIFPEDGGTKEVPTQLKEHPIPILDAVAAVEYAKEIIEGKKVLIEANIPNLFEPEIQFKFNTDLEIVDSKWTVTFGQGGASLDGDETGVQLVSFGTDVTQITAKVSGQLKHKETGVITDFSSEEESFNISKATFFTEDSSTLKPLSDVSIIVDSYSGLKSSTGMTNDEGKVTAYLLEGQYTVFASHNDFKDYAEKNIPIGKNGKSVLVPLALSSKSINPTGSIRGVVRDIGGEPIVNATVRISGGENTQGFIASAQTNEEGVYWLTNIGKKDTDGNLISNFMLSVTATGYIEKVKENVIVLDGKLRTESFDLEKQEIVNAVIYSTSFEENKNSWTGTGLWHIQELKTETSVVNTLVDNGFVTSPPDEESDHAYLPKADDGDSVMWYGLADTGSFINTQISGDSLKSGGKSTSSHSGTITSPSIDLTTSTQPILRFKTWWEIEAVNPNANGYDLMDVKISIDDGAFTTIKRLNPHVDPNIENRESIGLSSAGVFRKPIWVLEELDLSEYKGHNVRIQFVFDTKDELYNGFRGWLIDTLSIIEGTVVNDSVVKTMNKSYQKINILKQTIFDGLSDEYIRIHKKPREIKESQSFR